MNKFNSNRILSLNLHSLDPCQALNLILDSDKNFEFELYSDLVFRACFPSKLEQIFERFCTLLAYELILLPDINENDKNESRTQDIIENSFVNFQNPILEKFSQVFNSNEDTQGLDLRFIDFVKSLVLHTVYHYESFIKHSLYDSLSENYKVKIKNLSLYLHTSCFVKPCIHLSSYTLYYSKLEDVLDYYTHHLEKESKSFPSDIYRQLFILDSTQNNLKKNFMLFNLYSLIGHSDPDINLGLVQAATHGKDFSSFLLLLRNCPNIDYLFSTNTVLHHVATMKDSRYLVSVIQKNANLNIKSQEFAIPLQCAVDKGLIENVELLITLGTKQKQWSNIDLLQPLFNAAEKGRDGILNLLIEFGLNVNPKVQNRSALMRAIYYGNDTSAELLIENGADINCADALGNTPLILAANFGFITIILLLLKYGADINARNRSNRTPLSVACEYSKFDCIIELVKNKANINSMDYYGRTPLDYTDHEPEIINFLLSNGAKYGKELMSIKRR